MQRVCAWASRVAAVVMVSAAAAQPGPVSPDPVLIEPPPNPFLTLTHAEDWSIIAQVQILSCDNGIIRPINATTALPQTDIWALEGGRLWFPFAGVTSGSVPLTPEFGAEFTVGGTRVPVERKVVTFTPGVAPYAELEFGPIHGSSIRARMEFLRRSWRVTFDEQRAVAVAWPTKPYPEDVAATLAADYGVPYAPGSPKGQNPAQDWITKLTNGIDPKSRLGPALLAKFLTGEVIKRVQPARRGAVTEEGTFSGFWGGSALPPDAGWQALVRGRGSDIELVTALVSVLRQADIPTRLILGVRSTEDDDARIIDFEERNPVTAWAEFYLQDDSLDPKDGPTGGWIPIDIIRLRGIYSNQPRPLDQPWEYFGSIEQYDLYAPLAYHFTPVATSVYYGPPALYGWRTEPGTPDCGSHDVIVEITRPTRTGPGSMPVIQVGR